MTIHYTATLNNKHLSLTALYPDGSREVIAILPVTELGALINRNNRLMHLSFSSPFREITETVLVDTVDAERPGHHIGRMLSAIDACLDAEYAGKGKHPSRKYGFWRTLMCGFIAGIALPATVAGYHWMKAEPPSTLAYPTSQEWRAEPVTDTETPRPHTEHHVNSIPAPTQQEPSSAPAPTAVTEEQHVQAAEARRNLATVLKRNADRGMFTINLSTGHERTLYAFLDPACINCRLLEPALKQLAREFSVVIYPVSVIGGESSTKRTAPLLCEPDAQKRATGWHQLYSADSGMAPTGDAPAAQDGQCLTAARAAIDVNNQAFRQFGFGGTPWVLSDTGWHLPSGILKDATSVRLFLKATDTEDNHNEPASR
ncbi:thioredoxin fold domain-containing protein [Escherichia coli]|uniref:DsbC family protein n=1 Tax=Escherichia coli TaxID=562 RepID=UPI001694FF67|nr:thioredoxin fold domain-containing protein [Escherichia coli]EEV4475770.1 thioredoxin fold domain-containing protein [Escherichia coli]EEW6950100.1 thioredoxin fold domain-containing protein [Escherichia coli]EFJ1925508.1 thioredoxin fold domain-containing protein [Escherichia coli]EIV1713593.1 thioredoxin fold domain-containing protein [Escherichia coli]